MHWLQTLDVSLFRGVNLALSNSVLDVLMPFASGNPLFVPTFLTACILLIWKGGRRGRICVFMLILAIVLGDTLVCNTLKQLLHRPRPYYDILDAHLPKGIGRSGSGSMPSSHAANWAAATMVLLIYYRRSLWFMLPLAVIVSFSRVYNGVHYPSDVLIGAILGAGYAAGGVWTLDALWRWVGRRWFPLWWERLPSLINPVPRVESGAPERGSLRARQPGEFEAAAAGDSRAPTEARRFKGGPARAPDTAIDEKHRGPDLASSSPGEKSGEGAGIRSGPTRTSELLDQHLMRLAYVLIIAQLLAKFLYIASGKIDLAEDESYQWIWSKHLALSYYSKPPLIAYTQFLGTALWGDTVFGVRFFSPVISALVSIVLLRFMARVVNVRAAFWMSLLRAAVPLLAIGSTLMTIDPLSVMFWAFAMMAGWHAVRENSTTRDWLWVGLWMGLGFLSKYTALFQWLCWAVFFILWPPARKQLRRPGPYLALLVNLLCAVPVLIWNSQHAWITVRHVAENGSLDKHWAFSLVNLWTGFRRYTVEFVGVETILLNPFFVLPTVWAAIVFWRRKPNHPLLIYFFSMGAPLFLCYLLFTFHSRVLLNWIAPSILPLFCLGVVYWEEQWRAGFRPIKTWLVTGLTVGFLIVVVMHDTNLVGKLAGRALPPRLDPLRRVRAWQETARVVEAAREKLMAEGKPVFIIGGHYGITGEITFNLPEAKAGVPDHPLVYFRASKIPENQFYFWPGYQDRKGQNAIYVQELDLIGDRLSPPEEEIMQGFDSVKDLGAVLVMYRGQAIRRIQISECRGLR